MNNSYNFYVTAPVKKSILNGTLTMSLGIFIIFSFNLLDSYFIGQLGFKELSAFSYTFPITNLLSSLGLAFSVGVSAVIAPLFGAHQDEEGKKSINYSFIMSALVAVLITAFFMLTMDELYTLMGATPEELVLIKEYMRIWYPGFICIFLMIIANNVMSALGDAKTPGLVMLACGFLNIILDPILIFGWGPIPQLGMTGGAIATVTARSLNALILLYLILVQKKVLIKSGYNWAEAKRYLAPIGQIIAADLINFSLVPLSLIIITAMFATYGQEYVGVFGVFNRIEIIGTVFYFGLGAVLSAYVGQNLGANQYERIAQGVRWSYFICFVCGMLVAAILFVLAYPIATAFASDALIIERIVFTLRTIPLGFTMLGITIATGVVFNGLKSPFNANMIAFIRTFVLTVPLTYAGHRLFGFEGMCFGKAAGYILSGFASWWYAKKVLPVKFQVPF